MSTARSAATYFAYPRDVWMATRQGLTELGMPLLKESFDGIKGSLESRTADSDKVFVSLECLSPAGTVDGALTRLSIRIASFGDRKASERIFQQIGSHLTAPMIPQSSNQTALSGGAVPILTPVGAGVKPISMTNFVVLPPPASGNPLTAIPSAPTIIPSSGSAIEPPLADASADTTQKAPGLPPTPVPADPPRGNGA